MERIRFLRKKKNKGSIWDALGITLLLGSLTPAISWCGLMIVMHTGMWWFPLIIVYFIALGIPTKCWFEKRKNSTYHMHVGHEMYYIEHPDELKKVLKKVRKAGLPQDVQRAAAYYRSRPDVVKPFPAKKEKKRRVRAVIMNIGAAITVAVGVFLIFCAFPIRHDIFTQELITADYTSIFLLGAGILAITSGIGLFRNKPFMYVRMAAAAMIAISIWSAGLAYSILKRPSYMDSVTCAVCLGVFIISAFLLPAIAGDIRTAAQVSHDLKETRIELFEMGYLREHELRARIIPDNF